MAEIQFKGITKRYPDGFEAVKAIDLDIADGEFMILVDHYLSHLPARSREVLRLRFEEDLKQREIGAILGVSQMHVSRLIRQSVARLREVAETGSRPADR